jgi:hypothetical protein
MRDQELSRCTTGRVCAWNIAAIEMDPKKASFMVQFDVFTYMIIVLYLND